MAKLDLACTVGQIRRRPILWSRSLAGELILNAFRRIEDTDPLLEAFSIFNHRLLMMAGETLFIVDKNDRLAGHLSKQDIVDCVARPRERKTLTWTELSANPQWLPDMKVREVMHPDTVSVEPATPLKRVAGNHDRKRYPDPACHRRRPTGDRGDPSQGCAGIPGWRPEAGPMKVLRNENP